MELIERYRGALLGLAVGDALGAAVEFRPRGGFPPLNGMRGGGVIGLPAGAWTDDTSMALCLAESLVRCGGFDAADQMRTYARWLETGHLSSTGGFVDVGLTVAAAVRRFLETGEPYAGSERPDTAGNGSLMRLAPVVMVFAADPGTAVRFAALSSRTTHAAPEAVDACRYFAVLLCRAFEGLPPAECLVAAAADPLWAREPLAPAIRRIADGSFRDLPESEVRTTGYVVHTLEAALWALWRAPSFGAGCLLAANLGGDADTVAAVYGQLAGAHGGAGAIPAEWLEPLVMRDAIVGLADRLHDLRQAGPRTHTDIWPGAGTAPAAT